MSTCSYLVARTECMADLETYIKKDFMVKRSIMKSWLMKKENYKSRWFLLKKHYLCYYDGSLEVDFRYFRLKYVFLLNMVYVVVNYC